MSICFTKAEGRGQLIIQLAFYLSNEHILHVYGVWYSMYDQSGLISLSISLNANHFFVLRTFGLFLIVFEMHSKLWCLVATSLYQVTLYQELILPPVTFGNWSLTSVSIPSTPPGLQQPLVLLLSPASLLASTREWEHVGVTSCVWLITFNTIYSSSIQSCKWLDFILWLWLNNIHSYRCRHLHHLYIRIFFLHPFIHWHIFFLHRSMDVMVGSIPCLLEMGLQ